MMKDKRKINKMFANLVRYFQMYWYFGTIAFFSAYVARNWAPVTRFTFFSEFDGENVIFIVWILLILLPLINKFEGFGVKLESPFADIDKTADKLLAESYREAYASQSGIDEVERKLATLTEKVEDSDEV